MSCNCPDTNKCPSPTTCLCGLETNIYNSSGVLVETVIAYPTDVEGDTVYEVYNSTAFEPTLGQPYTLYIYYNYELERWEMSYGNETISSFVVIGVLYGVGPDDCPVSNCWDLDCIAVAFRVLGVFNVYFPWLGVYTNGKKSYTFTSDWSGSDIDYRIYWVADSSTFPSADAPVGTPAWILEEEVGPGVWQPAGYLFNSNKCPYGQYIVEFGGISTRYSFTDLGVTGFDLKTTILDCGCCDEKVSVTTYDGETFNVYELSVNYDEYGNVLVLNGYNYYSYVNGEIEYYLYVNSQGNWVLNTLFNNPETEIAYTPVSSDCPFGSYNINPAPEPCGCDTILVTYQLVGEEPVTVEVGKDEDGNYYLDIDGETYTIEKVGSEWTLVKVENDCNNFVKVDFTYDGDLYSFNVPKTGTNDGKNKFDLFDITIGIYTSASINIIWNNLPIPSRWSVDFLGTNFGQSFSDTNCPFGNYPVIPIPEFPITTLDITNYSITQAILSEDTPCPFGTFTIEEGSIFESFVVSGCDNPANIIVSVKGAECFDCCDYDTPKNRNLLKKKKAIFVDEISSIRNKEIFGFKCGPEWDDLFRKHLIFDVLWCLPYGKICDEEQQCLINNLNENCNC